MKNFFTLALLACIAVGKGDDDAKNSAAKPDWPDMSEFPDEWTNPCGDASECRAAPPSPSWSSIAKYNYTFREWLEICMNEPDKCRIIRGTCKMVYNPSYKTTLPNGNVSLIEFHLSSGVSSPVFMWTWM